jgi:thiamine biosynthesis protein ThiS
MKLTVNGEPTELPDNGTIETLLEQLNATQAHTALMRNGKIIPSNDWKNTTLNENDEIEILVFVGGG